MKRSFYLSNLLFFCAIFFSVAANATVPTVHTQPKNDTVCSGTLAKFFISATDTPGTDPMTYSWLVSTNAGASWDTVRDTTFYAGAGTDTLTVTSSWMLNGYWYKGVAHNSSGLDISNSASLKVDTSFAGAISGPGYICRSGTVTFTSSISGGTWSSSDLSLASINSSTGLLTATASGYGYDTVKYTLTNICGTYVSWMVVHIDSAITAQPIVGPTVTCAGHYITLTNANTIGTHVWSSSLTGVATVSSTGMVVGTGWGNTVIGYSFTNGCSSVSSFITVHVDTVLAAGVISGPSVVCRGSWMHLSETVSGGIWISSNSAVAVVDGSGNVTGVYQGVVNISYYSSNGCGASIATHAVTVNAPASIIYGIDSVGVGLTRTLFDTTIGGTWSVADTSIARVDSMGVFTGVAVGVTTASYTVTNSCGTTTATVPFYVGSLPTGGAIVGADSVCLGDSILLTNPSAPGGIWASAADTQATVSAGGRVKGLMYGPVNISYTYTNGFGTTTIIKTMFVNQPPVVTVTGPSVVKVGINYFLRAVPWGGVWTQSNTSVGTILAQLDSFSLVSYASIIINELGTPDVFTYSIHNTCGNRSATYNAPTELRVTNVSGNEGKLLIAPNPASGQIILNLETGTTGNASVTITNVVGEKMKQFTMPVNKNYDLNLDVPSGLYFINATTGNESYSGKIIINR
jgi:uncharacterized protein YjdB